MRIISDATLCTDFDACVNLFQDLIEQHGATHIPGHQRDAQLVSFRGETKASMDINKLTQVEDHYYKKEEYYVLTLEQKKVLHEKCGNHSHKKGAKDSALPFNLKPKTKASAKMMLSMHSIHAIATAVVEHYSGNDSTGSTSSDEELFDMMKEAPHKKTKVSSNRNNSTLQCKQTWHIPLATIGLATLHVAQLGSYTQVSDHDTRTELDSHADTTAVGTSTALVIHDYEQPICVHGYTGKISPDENCHIVSAMVAYDHP